MIKIKGKIIKENEKYVDEKRELKSILTDFINENMLKYNNNQIKLIKLIYDNINPILKKYKDAYLIFKGGNVMNLINNNILEYFPENSDDIIIKIFNKFLKKSDNDFTIYLNPKISNYNKIYKKLNFEIFEALDKIRNDIYSNINYYFYIYNMNNENIKKSYKKLIENLNKEKEVNSIKLNPIPDQIILFDENKDIIVYEYNYQKTNYIYNSLNFTLEFNDVNNNLIKFSLLRTKINFLLNGRDNIAGELIDISIPHKDDFEISKIDNFNKYIKKNIIKIKNNEINLKYNIINNDYIVKDLFKILFINNKFPWDDKKYEKRLARLIYFIFLSMLDNEKISIESLNNIKYCFNNFNKIDNEAKCNNEYLYLLNNFIDDIKSNSELFNDFIKKVNYYIKSTVDIINEIIKYQEGKENINENNLYEINIK